MGSPVSSSAGERKPTRAVHRSGRLSSLVGGIGGPARWDVGPDTMTSWIWGFQAALSCSCSLMWRIPRAWWEESAAAMAVVLARHDLVLRRAIEERRG